MLKVLLTRLYKYGAVYNIITYINIYYAIIQSYIVVVVFMRTCNYNDNCDKCDMLTYYKPAIELKIRDSNAYGYKTIYAPCNHLIILYCCVWVW